MYVDSETDSDSDAEVAEHLLPFYGDDAVSTLNECSEVFTIERALEGVRLLHSLDLGAALEGPILHVIQKSAGVLIKFVTTMPDLIASGDNLEGILLVFSALINATYLDRLFRIRTVFRELVARSNGRSCHPTTVAIWVDELLWGLSLVIPQLAGGFVNLAQDREELARRPQSIRDQIRNDGLRSVVQLPELWTDVHLVLGSCSHSPASKRVALSLLFGSYVMHQRLTMQELPKSITEASNILASLHDAATHIHATPHNGVSCVDLSSKRLAAALLVGLFAVISLYNEKDRDAEPSYLLPQRFGCLLDLIITVLNAESFSFYPLEKLDVPQKILLMWGNTVPWTWSTWPDQRVANTEYIRLLTSTWLCRMNDPIFEGCNGNAVNLNDELQQAFMKDIANSSLVVQQLYRDVEDYMDETEGSGIQPNSDLYKLLAKSTWALIQFLEYHAVDFNQHIESRMPDFIRHLLSIYSRLSLSVHEDLVKKLVLEALCLVDTGHFARALEGVLSAKPCRFLTRLEEATRTYARELSCGSESSSHISSEQSARAESFLSFFIILLLKDTSQKFELRETIRACFSAVVTYTKHAEGFEDHLGGLRHAVLTALCACTIVKARDLIPCTQEDAWILAIHTGKHDIMMTGTFAKYVVMAMKSLLDPLLLFEAWDHFSAALVTAIEQQVQVEEEAIALLVAPAICQALLRLITHSNPATKRLLASSLRIWTLRRALISVTRSDHTSDVPYLISMKERLGNGSMILKRSIDDLTNGSCLLNIATSNLVDDGYKLLYYRNDSHARLLIIHDTDLDQTT